MTKSQLSSKPSNGLLTLDYIEKYFFKTAKIILSASYCIQNQKALSISIADDSIIAKIKGWPFFRHYLHHMFFISTIELAKLFSYSNNHHYSLFHIIHKFENWDYDTELLEKLKSNKDVPVFHHEDKVVSDLHTSKESINDALCKLGKRIEQNKSSIERLKSYRDKVFAHYDEEVDNLTLFISAEDLSKLVLLSQEIYYQLYGRLFDVEAHFEFPDAHVKNIITTIGRGLSKR